MLLACLALTVQVLFPPVPPYAGVHETYDVRGCVPNNFFSDVPVGIEKSRCEKAANEILYILQMEGVLPGSKEIISYSVTCDVEV